MVDYRHGRAVEERGTPAYDIWVIIRSALWGVVISLLCFIIFAVVINGSNVQESTIPPTVQTIKIISVAIAGLLAAVATDSRGWLKGGVAGLIYILLALIITSMISSEPMLFSAMLNDAFMAFVAGAIGGIIGVTLKSK